MIDTKKIFAMGLALTMAFSFSACGDKTEDTAEPTAATERETIIPDPVDDSSEEAIAAKAAVAEYLDTFISGDIEKIKAALADGDEEYFNFDSEDQVAFYETIFPKITYEFDGVYEHDGVYGVMTTITSPDMVEVYGDIWTELLESATGVGSETEFRSNNLMKMVERLNSTDDPVPDRVEDLYIYVEHEDGEYITRCDIYLANELIGGAAEASSEISEAFAGGLESMTEN